MQSLIRTGAFLFTMVALMATSAAAELQWRSGRTTASKPSKTAAAQRFARPHSTYRRIDSSVQLAAHDEQGPQLSSDSKGQARLRSVVVDRSEAADNTRSAQLPPAGAGAPQSEATETRGTTPGRLPESQFEEQLRSPFGDMPGEIPDLQVPEPGELDVDTMPLPQDRGLPPDDTLQPPVDRQPFEPSPGEFQPQVPPTIPTPRDTDGPAPSDAAVEADRQRAEAACTENLVNLRENTIDKLNLSIVVSGTEGTDYPFECTLSSAWHPGRAWPQTTYLWKASALCHKPLYFEDEQLERYGHSWPPCFQPFVSGAHFFTRLPVLPYCMGVEPPLECVYALGHYRPNSCAPYMCNPVPISCRGALIQAGAVTGAAAVLP